MRIRALSLALLGASLLSFPPSPAFAEAKKPLDYRAYDGWKSIQRVTLTDDGTRAAYVLAPQDGEPTLVVRLLATGEETRDARGTAPEFAEDGSFVAFTLAPKHEALEEARKKGKPPIAEVPSGFGVRTFGDSGSVKTFENVKSWKKAKHGSRFVAYWGDPPKDGVKPSPSASASASPEASPTESPKAAPSASASPDPIAVFKKKDDAKTLTLLDVSSGSTTAIRDVTDYAFSADESTLAYAVETKAGTTDGLFVRDLKGGTTIAVVSGSGRYKHLTFAPEKTQLAFVADAATYDAPAPRYGLYEWEPGMTAAVRLDDPAARKSPSENHALRFSRDGARLFSGIAVPATPEPTNTPVPIAMDLWNYRDLKLQTEQRVEADATRKRSDTVVTWLGAAPRTVTLVPANDGTLIETESARYALVDSDLAHRMAASWDGGRRDVFAVDLRSGAKRMLVQDTRFEPKLNASGTTAIAFDDRAQHWVAIRTADAKRTMCAAPPSIAFGDELDDHPDVRPPYGELGFTADDRHAVVMDRFDAWSCDLANGRMTRLTHGREKHVRYQYVTLDPDERALPATLTFTTFDDVDKRAGLATLAPGARTTRDTPLVAGVIGKPVKAKKAATAIVARGSFAVYPDLYLTDTRFASFTKISDANPQQAQYRWGTSRLVHWTSAFGQKLDGVLLVPDNLDPKAKAPMLVYFYERYADELNRYRAPGPGTSPSLMRYVSNGYVVFLPDVAYKIGHPGPSALAAILPGVEAAEKAMGGRVDDKRVGIAGHSWAAYQIVYMLTKTHRFRAAEAGAAVANMTSAYGGIRWGPGVVREFQYEVSQSRIGATPWERPDLYLENSALFHITSITTPYLTIANDADDAVPWYQGIEFFTAMRRLHKEAYMFVYNNELHNLRGRENQKHWTVHMDEYFDHYLKGAPAPSWMTKGVDYVDRGKRDVRALYGETP